MMPYELINGPKERDYKKEPRVEEDVEIQRSTRGVTVLPNVQNVANTKC